MAGLAKCQLVQILEFAAFLAPSSRIVSPLGVSDLKMKSQDFPSQIVSSAGLVDQGKIVRSLPLHACSGLGTSWAVLT